MDTIPEGWLQFLFVAVPVLSLIGTWMGLRTVRRMVGRQQDDIMKKDGDKGERSDSGMD